jgi:lipid-A-disaccharide synthase-like uncharacterized protein
MNEDQFVDMDQPQELSLTQQALASLKTAANWSMFMAIIGFIGIGFMVIAGIVTLGASSVLEGSTQGSFPFPFWILSLLYWVIAILYFFPQLYLFRFSSKMKQALQFNETPTLTESFYNLGKHYKYLGIMTILIIAMYFIFFISMFIFGISAFRELT